MIHRRGAEDAESKDFSLAVEGSAREKFAALWAIGLTMDINKSSNEIIGAAIEVHKALGPGLPARHCECSGEAGGLEFYPVKLNAYKLIVCWSLGGNKQISD